MTVFAKRLEGDMCFSAALRNHPFSWPFFAGQRRRPPPRQRIDDQRKWRRQASSVRSRHAAKMEGEPRLSGTCFKWWLRRQERMEEHSTRSPALTSTCQHLVANSRDREPMCISGHNFIDGRISAAESEAAIYFGGDRLSGLNAEAAQNARRPRQRPKQPIPCGFCLLTAACRVQKLPEWRRIRSQSANGRSCENGDGRFQRPSAEAARMEATQARRPRRTASADLKARCWASFSGPDGEEVGGVFTGERAGNETRSSTAASAAESHDAAAGSAGSHGRSERRREYRDDGISRESGRLRCTP